MTDSDDIAISRREILLRRIGHELLLQSGDSTSRVLPVKKIAENEYQISFENELTFQSDSLVNTTQRLLAKNPLADDYVVTVLNSDKSGVAYGYAISKNKKDDIVACIGRKQSRARYMINIKFKPTSINTVKNEFLIGGLPFLAFVGFIFLRFVRMRLMTKFASCSISRKEILMEYGGLPTLVAVRFKLRQFSTMGIQC